MNERIKQLVDQAWKQRELITASRSLDEAFTSKFAELIVRRCIAEVAMMGVVHYDNKDISWAVDLIIGNLKDQFGVEE